jgi:hypothetical protein
MCYRAIIVRMCAYRVYWRRSTGVLLAKLDWTKFEKSKAGAELEESNGPEASAHLRQNVWPALVAAQW